MSQENHEPDRPKSPPADGRRPWLEVGTMVTLALAIAGAIYKFGNLEGRLDSVASGDALKRQVEQSVKEVQLAATAAKSNLKLPDLPVGAIVSYAGSIDVSALEAGGWLLCNGQQVSSGKYPHLCQVLGTKWGGTDELNGCRLPNLNGTFLRGAVTNQQIGATGGSESASHSHHIKSSTLGLSKFWGPKLKDVRPQTGTLSQESGEHSHALDLDTQPTEVSLLPPFATVYFLIKAVATDPGSSMEH